jgi:predicted AlkP superfamily phosphohydrolase/phosphomutase
VSDHGFGELKKTFFVNKWLRSKKYLRVKGVHSDNLLGRIGKTVEWSYLTLGKIFSKIPGITWLMSGINEIIGQDKLGKLTYEYLSTAKLESRVAWKRTQAFSCIHSPHFGQIYINQRQKMSKGTVKQKDVKLYRERIIEDLKTLVDPKTGDPIKVDVYLPEELYSGEHLDEAPDVIFMLDDGKIEVDATLEEGEIFDEGSPLTGWTGTHTRDGILIAYGPQIQRSKKINNLDIIDIAPTILHAFGVPIPDDVDGKPINEIFIDGALIKQKEEITKESIMEQDTALSSEEKALIEERLRKLGYIT